MHAVISNTATAGRHIMYDEGDDANLDAAEEARVVRQALFGRLGGRWIKSCGVFGLVSDKSSWGQGSESRSSGGVHLPHFTMPGSLQPHVPIRNLPRPKAGSLSLGCGTPSWLGIVDP